MEKKIARLPDSKADREFLRDMIMQNAWSCESFEMSLSRLAKTAWMNGFDVLGPTEVIACYVCCRELSEGRYGERPITIWGSRICRRKILKGRFERWKMEFAIRRACDLIAGWKSLD